MKDHLHQVKQLLKYKRGKFLGVGAFWLLMIMLSTAIAAQPTERIRMIIFTDVDGKGDKSGSGCPEGDDSDDHASLVRLMVYSNEFDIEGTYATTNSDGSIRPCPEIIRNVVKLYGEVLSNLRLHASGYPSKEYLLDHIKVGINGNRMTSVGEGKSSEASDHLKEVVDAALSDPSDPRPIWIISWDGLVTLAQALHEVKRDRTPEQLASFVDKIRVYTISEDTDGEYSFHEESIEIPETDSRWIIVNCTVDGKSGTANFDDLFLGITEREDTPLERATTPLVASITVDAGKSIRSIPKTLFGTNAEWKWDGNGIWDREKQALQEEIVELTKAMHVSLIRYPGGTLSDYYHWRDGVGPVEKRPFRTSLPGEDKSQLVFGTNEALEFAKRVGAHLLVTVNMVTGTAEEAADWVEYINKEQAAHDESKRVTYWQLGNENYIQWIPGVPEYFRTSSLSAEQYTERVESYAEAMKAVDSSIKLIGILDSDPDSKWNRKVLEGIAGKVDYVAIHNGYAPGFLLDSKTQIRKLYQALLAKPLEIRENLQAFSEIIESLEPGTAENLKLAVTEWGPIFSVDLQSGYLNHTQTLGSGLYAASVLMALIDSPRTDMANFFHLVDQLFVGWLGTREGHHIMKPTALAFQLFTEHLGDTLVASQTESSTYDSPLHFERIPPMHDVPYLETLASLDEEGAKLSIIVINKHFDVPIDTEIILEGFRPGEKASIWTLTGTGLDANPGAELFQAPGINWPEQIQDPLNPRYAKGGPGEVEIRKSSLDQVGDRFRYVFPPHSVTAIEIHRAP